MSGAVAEKSDSGHGLAARRPQTFSDVIGHAHVVQTLRHALQEGRVAHAYLFTGPRGVGKTSLARLLAKGANCQDPQAERPCGQCEACRAIAAGRSTDVIEMDAASHTGVDDARDLIERSRYRPAELRYKVYILDEVHMLSRAAFDALLKTLEEPPSHVLFLLATTETHKIPDTVLSRCQRFALSRHSLDDIRERLVQVARAEGMQLSPSAADAIARAATGSLRDAVSLLEQLAAFAGKSVIDLSHVASLLGSTGLEDVDVLLQCFIEQDTTRALQVVNELADQGQDMRHLVRGLVDRLREILLLLITPEQVSDSDQRQLRERCAALTSEQVTTWLGELAPVEYQLRQSSYGHLPLELALIEMLGVGSTAFSVAHDKETRGAARGAAGPQTIDADGAEEPVTPVPESSGLSVADVRAHWGRVVAHLAGDTLLQAVVRRVEPVALQATRVQLRATDAFCHRRLHAPGVQPRLSQALTEVWQTPLSCDIVPWRDQDVQPAPQERLVVLPDVVAPPTEPETCASTEPDTTTDLLQVALDTFHAHLLSVQPRHQKGSE